MKAQALFLLGVVAVTHYGYPLFASATDEPETWASWAFYIIRGVEGVALFGLLLQVFQGTGLWPRIGVIACWLGMFEEAQTAICGVIVAPSTVVPLWSGLCVEQFGRAPYLIVMAAAIAYILTGGRHRERET